MYWRLTIESKGMQHRLITLLAAFTLLLSLAACSSPATAEPAEPVLQTTEVQDSAVGEPNDPLRIALLPILDSLPYYVAEEQGYFAEENVAVEVVPVGSGLERDQLMQAGEIDGMLTEMPVVATFNQAQPTIQILISARKAYPDAPLFRILAAPGSDITAPADLAGVPIGISENTIIEYVTDRILENEGLAPEDIVGESVPAIPERFQLLMEGQLQAANLPDPLAQSAIEQGAINVIDDSSYPEYAVSVLAFSNDTLDAQPEAVRAFLRAWDRAAADINDNPEAFRALLLDKVQVPENVQDTYNIPPFPRGEVPSQEQWADVNDWLIGKGLLESQLPYEESVSTEFLP